MGEPDSGAHWRVFPLEDLSDGFEHLDGREAMVAYAESAVAAQLLVERIGPDLGVFLQMLAAMTRWTRRSGPSTSGRSSSTPSGGTRRHPLPTGRRRIGHTTICADAFRAADRPAPADTILFLGASLRFFPIRFGLTYHYSRPDETEPVGDALAMLGAN